MDSFRDVIAAWPSRTALAADVGVHPGVVKQWHLRNNIPASRWAAVVSAAQEREINDVTLDRLAFLAERQAA